MGFAKLKMSSFVLAPISSSLGRTDAPPAYGDLFPGIQNVRDQVDKARQSEGPAPAPVAVPLTLCNILCKSCKDII